MTRLTKERVSAMTKMIDVARHAGVSIKTVSRVLNNEPHVQEMLREKVREAVRVLNYVPSTTARSLRSNRSYCITLICHTDVGPYVHDIQFGALQACQDAGYKLIVSLLNIDALDKKDEMSAWRDKLLKDGAPDGVILVPPVANDKRITDMLTTFGIRITRIGPDILDDGCATVSIDDRAAAREAVEHLISQGHRRIGLVRGKEEQIATPRRYEGYIDALSAASIPVDEALILPGDFDFDSGRQAGDRYFDMTSPPTAVFASNDNMAAGLIISAHRHGLRVPDDISIIGFDDAEIAQKIWPSLTTIRQPFEDLGKQAAKLIIDGAGNSKNGDEAIRLTIPHELVLRDSARKL